MDEASSLRGSGRPLADQKSSKAVHCDAVGAAVAALQKVDAAAAAAKAGDPGFTKGYRRKDGCPVPDWFVDKHHRDKETWKTKKEQSLGGGGKRRKY